jgi:hypothetical protein
MGELRLGQIVTRTKGRGTKRQDTLLLPSPPAPGLMLLRLAQLSFFWPSPLLLAQSSAPGPFLLLLAQSSCFRPSFPAPGPNPLLLPSSPAPGPVLLLLAHFSFFWPSPLLLVQSSCS